MNEDKSAVSGVEGFSYKLTTKEGVAVENGAEFAYNTELTLEITLPSDNYQAKVSIENGSIKPQEGSTTKYDITLTGEVKITITYSEKGAVSQPQVFEVEEINQESFYNVNYFRIIFKNSEDVATIVSSVKEVHIDSNSEVLAGGWPSGFLRDGDTNLFQIYCPNCENDQHAQYILHWIGQDGTEIATTTVNNSSVAHGSEPKGEAAQWTKELEMGGSVTFSASVGDVTTEDSNIAISLKVGDTLLLTFFLDHCETPNEEKWEYSDSLAEVFGAQGFSISCSDPQAIELKQDDTINITLTLSGGQLDIEFQINGEKYTVTATDFSFLSSPVTVVVEPSNMTFSSASIE